MKALSLRQAANCENASKPRCACRCGGFLHGARRVVVVIVNGDSFTPSGCMGYKPDGSVCRSPAAGFDKKVGAYLCDQHLRIPFTALALGDPHRLETEEERDRRRRLARRKQTEMFPELVP